jgi:molybdopterin biosynthesis enzyme
MSRFQSDSVGVPLYTSRPPQHIIPAASWARSREELLPERSLLRAADIAMLEVLGIEEVEVHRKPVVGIASLGLPMPVAQRRSEQRQNQQMMVTGGGPPRRGDEEMRMVRVCPLTTLAVNLCKTAQIAALPLGFAPAAFRPLARAVSRWLSQVDVLLLIGGPSHGPRCLAQDVIAAQGKLAVAGMDLDPAGGLSAGIVDNRPVIAIPGGLADVAVGLTIFARPLIHKHNPPVGYSPELPIALEYGSQLRPERDLAVPVRYGYSSEFGMQSTRYRGQRGRDPWLDIARGQAFIVLEAGREYNDGEVVRGFPY